MQQDTNPTQGRKGPPSVRALAAKARRAIGKSRAKKLDKAVDQRDRQSPHANHAFALLAYGSGRHRIMLKPVAQVNPYSVSPVVARHLDRYLFKLPTAPFPVRWKGNVYRNDIGHSVSKFVWSDDAIMMMCLWIGGDVKYPDKSPNLARLNQQYGLSVENLLTLDNTTPVLWVEVDQWDRALESQKLFAFCQTAAQSGGFPVTINLDPSLVDQAVRHPKGVADFLRSRLRDRLKRLIPRPQYAMGIDLNDRGKFHLHGTLIIPPSVDRVRLETALKSFAGNDHATTVKITSWMDLPGGYGGYSAKAGAAVTKALQRRAREVGGRVDQPVTFATQSLIGLAREWWNSTRLENRALLLELAAEDVGSRL